MSTLEFQAWPKIPRWENEKFFYTEKIDGTNAAIVFDDSGDYIVQSRSRIIVPGDDNFGFAAWVADNIRDLEQLGPGAHFGEWWGKGIQRGYGLDERRFSLFNTQRWNDNNPNRPACVHVVPTIHASSIETARFILEERGSLAAPGFMNVEGVVIYAYEARKFYKSIINK